MNIPFFDAHCDTAWRIYTKGESLTENSGHVDLERLGKLAGAKQLFALYADHNFADDFPALYSNMLGYFISQLEENGDKVELCRTAKQAELAVCRGKTAAFLSIEGGELISCDAGRLREAFQAGVRCIAPVWNHDNAWCGSVMDGAGGLTQAGISAVKTAQELGMIVDVSHMSRQGFEDLCRVTDGPFAATHSNAFSLCPHPRNLTDDQIREIAARGGVVGINLYAGFLGENCGIDTVLRHVEHFLALGGENTVCFGCDFDGCDQLPQGVSGVENISEIYSAFQGRGYSPELLRALFHDNLNRLVEKICVI